MPNAIQRYREQLAALLGRAPVELPGKRAPGEPQWLVKHTGQNRAQRRALGRKYETPTPPPQNRPVRRADNQ